MGLDIYYMGGHAPGPQTTRAHIYLLSLALFDTRVTYGDIMYVLIMFMNGRCKQNMQMWVYLTLPSTV